MQIMSLCKNLGTMTGTGLITDRFELQSASPLCRRLLFPCHDPWATSLQSPHSVIKRPTPVEGDWGRQLYGILGSFKWRVATAVRGNAGGGGLFWPAAINGYRPQSAMVRPYSDRFFRLHLSKIVRFVSSKIRLGLYRPKSVFARVSR